MNDINLISVEDIRNVTSISNNITDDLLQPYIFLSEDFFVYPILGDALATELKNQITANTLTTLNNTLLTQFIIPLAAWGAWYNYIPFNTVKSTTAGEVEQAGDGSTNADLQKIAFKRASIKDFINHCSKKLKDYLEDNKTSYPLYRSTCCTTDNNNFGGIYLGYRG
jgi:hypothetical protein